MNAFHLTISTGSITGGSIVGLGRFIAGGFVSRVRQRVYAEMKLIDIAANLTDEMYQGVYHGKQYHQPDLHSVLDRARKSNIDKIIITAGSLEMSKEALRLAESESAYHESPGFLYSTVGVHPTRCNEFGEDAEGHLIALTKIAEDGMQKGKVVAIGECGLDYDRLEFSDKDTQKHCFEIQFGLSAQTRLPMFLHMRNACADFVEILERNRSRFHGGVVHSFTGSFEDYTALSAFDDLFIGINGCSLKTEDNLKVVSEIPIDRMMIETDCPYCEIRNSHAGRQHIHPSSLLKAVDKKKHDGTSPIKSRNEPCNIQYPPFCRFPINIFRQVLEVVAAVKGMETEILAEQLYDNSIQLFKMTSSETGIRKDGMTS